MTKVKICGIRSLDAARAVRESGADFAGLNFVPTSRRRIAPDDAKRLVAELGEVTPVGVFMDQTVDEITGIATRLGLEFLQLHGREPRSVVETLAKRFRIIKAVSMEDTVPEPKDAERGAAWTVYERVASFLLVDGRSPGQGKPFDWSRLDPSQIAVPFFVAGGLHAGNVESAIALLRPYGVDTASGVELDGNESIERIWEFVNQVRGQR